MDISTLKKKRFDIDKLVQAAQEINGGEQNSKNGPDERIWKPTVDKAGNGYAVLRFLPAPESDLPWVRYWDHGFKGPTGKWYIEKSLTSIGEQDPLGEVNSRLWNSGNDEDKETARKQKRRLHYVTNVLVVADPSAPQNEGKVFIYQFGKKIFDKIMDMMQPQFPGEEPVNPFDLWEGAEFQLKIRQVEGYRNYDRSEFKSPSMLFDGDEDKIQSVLNNLYDINEFVDPKNYKTYDQLKTKLMEVLGESAPRTVKQEVAMDTVAAAPVMKEAPAPTFSSAAEDDDYDSSDEDDTMSYFQKLANAD
jgi:hypothetical protein